MKYNQILGLFCLFILAASFASAKEIVFYASEGISSPGELFQMRLIEGLTEPPSSCTINDYTGVVVQGTCKGLTDSMLSFKIYNDQEAYLKVNLVDCKTQEIIEGTIVINPGEFKNLNCPAGFICKPIYTIWHSCGVLKPAITGHAVKVTTKECVPRSRQQCIGNDLAWFDSCGHPETTMIKCAFGCAGAACNPSPIRQRIGRCGDRYCVPPFEGCESCPVDCGECLKQESQLEVRFPLGFAMLLLVLFIVIVSITYKKRQKK